MTQPAVGRVGFAPNPGALLDRILAWAQADGGVQAVLLLGSRARSQQPADEWSDTDLILVVDDPDAFLSDASWPGRFGEVAITFTEVTMLSERERRVLYADGTDLDVVPMSRNRMERHLQDSHALLALGRGHRVVLDKVGVFIGLEEKIAGAQAATASSGGVPEQASFDNLVSDFWYHAVWSARKLRRGELWVAHDCIDGYMKRLLLQVVEWQANLQTDAPDTWFGGRFLETWADPSVQEALSSTFGRHDAADLAGALRATMNLFQELATDIAGRTGVAYPYAADMAATALVDELLPV